MCVCVCVCVCVCSSSLPVADHLLDQYSLISDFPSVSVFSLTRFCLFVCFVPVFILIGLVLFRFFSFVTVFILFHFLSCPSFDLLVMFALLFLL